jgi:hypothetical protein
MFGRDSLDLAFLASAGKMGKTDGFFCVLPLDQRSEGHNGDHPSWGRHGNDTSGGWAWKCSGGDNELGTWSCRRLVRCCEGDESSSARSHVQTRWQRRDCGGMQTLFGVQVLDRSAKYLIDAPLQIPLAVHKAITGATIQVPTLEGSNVDVNIPPGTQPNYKHVLPGRGVKRLEGTGRGNLNVIFKVKIPKLSELSAERKRLMEEYATITDRGEKQ